MILEFCYKLDFMKYFIKCEDKESIQ